LIGEHGNEKREIGCEVGHRGQFQAAIVTRNARLELGSRGPQPRILLYGTKAGRVPAFGFFAASWRGTSRPPDQSHALNPDGAGNIAPSFSRAAFKRSSPAPAIVVHGLRHRVGQMHQGVIHGFYRRRRSRRCRRWLFPWQAMETPKGLIENVRYLLTCSPAPARPFMIESSVRCRIVRSRQRFATTTILP
jgi:hypothetical protein